VGSILVYVVVRLQQLVVLVLALLLLLLLLWLSPSPSLLLEASLQEFVVLGFSYQCLLLISLEKSRKSNGVCWIDLEFSDVVEEGRKRMATGVEQVNRKE
jgi:hypothetical protein